MSRHRHNRNDERGRENRRRNTQPVAPGATPRAVHNPASPQSPLTPFAPMQTALQPYQVGSAALTQGLNVAGNNTIPVDAVKDRTPVNLVFSPGDPIRPTPGMSDGTGAPRQWAYPVGSNISPTPRQTEATPFDTLRNLAALYEGIQLCEETYNRILDRLDLQLVPSPDILGPEDDPSADKWRTPARAMRDWFLAGPDRRGDLDLTGWMKAAVKDVVEIDALGVYHRPTRGGGLFALELVAGDTLTMLEDTGGRTPLPPYPAYQQNLYGAPGVWLTTAELDLLRTTPRTNSRYGMSKVERIMLRVNQALRKESFDMARFTDGATPMGIATSSDPALIGRDLTPDMVQQFEDMFNAMLAGNDAMRVRTKFLLPGYTWQSTRPEAIATEFDRYLLNVTTAVFGLTLDELGFTETSNRSVGAAQENVTYRNAVKPLSDYFARYFTSVINRFDGLPLSPVAASLSAPGKPTKSGAKSGGGTFDGRFICQWGGIEEPEDFSAKANAYGVLVNNGIVTRTEAKRALKIPVGANEANIPLIITAQGGAQSLVDVETWLSQVDKQAQASDAQLDAQIAGSKQTAQAFASGVNPAAAQNGLAQQHQQAQTQQDGGKVSPASQNAQPAQNTSKGAQVAPRPAQSATGASTNQSREKQSNGTGNLRPRAGARRLAAGSGPDGGWDGDAGDAVGIVDAESDDDGAPDSGTRISSVSDSRDNRTGSGAVGAADGSGSASRTGERAGAEGRRASASGGAGSEQGARQAEVAARASAEGQGERQRQVADEWARYRRATLNALKSGKRAPDFASDVLPPAEHARVARALGSVRDREAARAIFAPYLSEALTPSSRSADAAVGAPVEHTGIMVALMLNPEQAQALSHALPVALRTADYAEQPSDYHITLTYNGDMGDDRFEPQMLNVLRSVVQKFVTSNPDVAHVLTGHVGGVGRFTPEDKDEHPLFASVDIPGIQALRAGLVEAMNKAIVYEAIAPHNDFEFTPHITLAYLPAGAPNPVITLPAIPLRFQAITLAHGDQRETFALHSQPTERVADVVSAPLGAWEAVLAELRSQRAVVMNLMGE